jgi:hypothetical protein
MSYLNHAVATLHYSLWDFRRSRALLVCLVMRCVASHNHIYLLGLKVQFVGLLHPTPTRQHLAWFHHKVDDFLFAITLFYSYYTLTVTLFQCPNVYGASACCYPVAFAAANSRSPFHGPSPVGKNQLGSFSLGFQSHRCRLACYAIGSRRNGWSKRLKSSLSWPRYFAIVMTSVCNMIVCSLNL